MQKNSYLPMLFLFVLLFVIMSFPQKGLDHMRQYAIAGVAPVWSRLSSSRQFIASKLFFAAESAGESSEALGNSYLALENKKLTAQMEGIYEWLLFDQRIAEQVEYMQTLSRENRGNPYWNEFFRRRSEELRRILEIQLQALPAKVIFREPASWSSSIWINIGDEDNESLGRLIVAKNSPVVLGDSLVGLVEFVGKKESRVRLITDSGLIPAVRAVRGACNDRQLASLARSFFDRIAAFPDLFSSIEDRRNFFNILSKMIEKLSTESEDWYLAKGELYGSCRPLWRSLGQVLKGVGFNYEFADRDGPARDLRSGACKDASFQLPAMEIIKEGDLLITSGLDGIFPPGLQVATVQKVEPLKEGAYAYEIEAQPTALNLQDLSVVFVMPPQTAESAAR